MERCLDVNIMASRVIEKRHRWTQILKLDAVENSNL